MSQLSTRKYLTPEEHAQLSTRLKNLLPFEPRNASLIALALHTGARCKELINLRYEDLDVQTKSVFIKGVKASNNRQVPLPLWLFEALIQLPRKQTLFGLKDTSSARKIWYSLRPAKKPFHCLRHTKAMRILIKTKDFLVVKTWLGHKSESSTNVYISHSIELEHMRKGLEE